MFSNHSSKTDVENAIDSIDHYPAKYAQLIDRHNGAIALLEDYCSHVVYYLQNKHYEQVVRFFKGDWNHHHVETVKGIVKKYDSAGLCDMDVDIANHPILKCPEFKDVLFDRNANVMALLYDLNLALREAGIPLNPKGELVRRIKFIHETLNIKVSPINLVEVCFDLSNSVEMKQLSN